MNRSLLALSWSTLTAFVTPSLFAQVVIPDAWEPTRFDAQVTPAIREQAAALIWYRGIDYWNDWARALSAAYGDIDQNGTVEPNDVLMIQRAIGKVSSDEPGPSYELLLAGDVTMDQKINQADADEATARLGTLTYSNGFDFLLGLLVADPPKIPETRIPTWPGRSRHSNAMTDTWDPEHALALSGAWPPNHNGTITGSWTPDGHTTAQMVNWDNPYRHIPGHTRSITKSWPANHQVLFSALWPTRHQVHTSDRTSDPANHSISLSNTWPPNHTVEESRTWGPIHEISASRMRPPGHHQDQSSQVQQPTVHQTDLSGTWNPYHSLAVSSERWLPGHTHLASIGWSYHNAVLSRENWPPGHYQVVSVTWGPEHRNWPPNHAIWFSESWGQPENAHSAVRTAKDLKDVVPGGQ